MTTATDFILQQLNKIIDHSLELDPTAKVKLQQIPGNINVSVTPAIPDHNLTISTNGAIALNLGHVATANCTITGPLKAFISIALSRDYNIGLKSGLTINGRANYAQDLAAIILHLDIDWEEELAKITGDYIATCVSNTKNKFDNLATDSKFKFLDMLKEYLEEELKLLPKKDDTISLAKDITALKLQVERLEARIALLGKTI